MITKNVARKRSEKKERKNMTMTAPGKNQSQKVPKNLDLPAVPVPSLPLLHPAQVQGQVQLHPYPLVERTSQPQIVKNMMLLKIRSKIRRSPNSRLKN